MPQEPRQLKRARRASHRAMLREEARALRRLRQAAQMGAQQPRARAAIAAAVALATHAARRSARQTARQRLNVELRALRGLGFELQVAQHSPPLPEDSGRAIVVGNTYARDAARRAADGDWLRALDATDYRLRRIATTEVAGATSSERDRALRETRTEERTAGGLILAKWWDASMDKRTCPICERANGTIRLPGMSFPQGEPGNVHPNCRCYVGLLPIPIAYDYTVNLYEAA